MARSMRFNALQFLDLRNLPWVSRGCSEGPRGTVFLLEFLGRIHLVFYLSGF